MTNVGRVPLRMEGEPVLIGYLQRVIPIAYLQSDPHLYLSSCYLRMLVVTCSLMEYFTSPTQIFYLIRTMHLLLSI